MQLYFFYIFLKVFRTNAYPPKKTVVNLDLVGIAVAKAETQKCGLSAY